jgi:ribosomal-protein-alanine N-acetyltransferase
MTAPTLTGDRVVLRALREDDAEERRRHGRSADLERGYGVVVEDGPMSADDARGWYEYLLTRPTDSLWVIEHERRGVGVTFLHQLDENDQRARFAIGFHDPSVLGHGLGRETTMLVLDHAFGSLGLHRVDLLVLEFNARAVASYVSCGFVLDGRLRENCFMAGRWYDDLVMSVLAHEHAARRGGSIA